MGLPSAPQAHWYTRFISSKDGFCQEYYRIVSGLFVCLFSLSCIFFSTPLPSPPFPFYPLLNCFCFKPQDLDIFSLVLEANTGYVCPQGMVTAQPARRQCNSVSSVSKASLISGNKDPL